MSTILRWRWLLLCVIVFVVSRQISYPIDTRMVLPSIGEMFQSQSVVAYAKDIPNVEYLAEFDGIQHWVNAPTFDSAQLKGKVTLVHFWSYSCVQCVDSIPYLKGWWSTYRRFGLQIVGVHSPSYVSEERLERVSQAVEDFGITYPVGFDDNFAVWRSFSNRVWPAVYLFDETGHLAYSHMGVGAYEETEAAIQSQLGVTPDQVQAIASATPKAPEYLSFGHKKQYWFVSPENIIKDQSALYSFPVGLTAFQWALEGEWTIYEDRAESVSPNAKLRLFLEKPTLLLALSNAFNKQTKVVVRVDGKFVDPAVAGADLVIESALAGESSLVIERVAHHKTLQKMPGGYLLELTFQEPGGTIHSANFSTGAAE